MLSPSVHLESGESQHYREIGHNKSLERHIGLTRMARVCLADGLSGENADGVDGELIVFVKGSIGHS